MKKLIFPALLLFGNIVGALLFKQKEITELKISNEFLKQENKRLDDSLFFIGYNFVTDSFKNDYPVMDSLYRTGGGKCFTDGKKKVGFGGF